MVFFLMIELCKNKSGAMPLDIKEVLFYFLINASIRLTPSFMVSISVA